MATLTCLNGHRFALPRVAYGYPTPETFEAAERGEVTIGGCLPGEPVERACAACGVIAYSEPDGRPDGRPERSATDAAKP